MAINALSQFHSHRPPIVLDVDRESRVPLHEQLCLQFRAAIHTGRLDPSAPLPPEPELAADLGVSRFTLRQALGQLVREGLLKRQRGRGTFVVEPPDGEAGAGRVGQHLGQSADVEIVQVGLAYPAAGVAATLGITPTDVVVEIVQRRLVDGQVVAVEQITFDALLLPIAGLVELDGADLYDLLERHGGVALTGARETVRAISLDAETACLLAAEPGSAALDVERQTVAEGRIVELRRTIFPAATGAIELQLSRPNLNG
jgi:GntR family transcriptional regulator